MFGAYFRDETLWRGKMVALASELRATLYELGFWMAALYVGFAASNWYEGAPLFVGLAICVRTLFGYLEEVQGRRRIDKDIERYFDEIYPPRH